MDFALPPEVTSTMIYTGPGSLSLISASLAWSRIAEQLDDFAAQHATLIADLAWVGPSAVAMRSASATIVSWARMTALQAAQTALSAAYAASAYETVRASITAPVAVYANRGLLAQLIATNVLGQNFPAIAATEAQYSEMWATNTAAMAGYHAASTQATGPLTTFMNLVSGFPGLSRIVAPGSNQSTAGLAGLLNLLDGATNSSLGTFLNSNLLSTGVINSATNLVGALPGFIALGEQQQNSSAESGGTPESGSSETAPVETPSTTASLGAGRPIGALTVPPGWTPTAAGRLAAGVTPTANTAVAPGGGVLTPLALPLGLRGGTPLKTQKPEPEYGLQPTIMPKHPYGG